MFALQQVRAGFPAASGNPPTPRGSAPSMEQASGLLFAGFLLLLIVEYIGLGASLPILKVTRFSTLLGWGLLIVAFIRLGPKVVGEHRQLRLLWYLVLFTGLTVFWAVVRSYAPQVFRHMLDYFGLALVTVFVMDRPSRMTRLSTVFSGIVLVLVFRNLDKLTSGERVGAMKAGYFMGDGNDLAWGLVTLLMFPLYLLLGPHSIGLRALGGAGALAAVGGIVGTQSRGATLALGAAMLTYWLFVAKRKLLGMGALALSVCVILAVAPPQYFGRLKTLQNVEEDTSAQGRIRAWKAALSMALTRPFGVGAGSFNSAYGRYYMPEDDGWGTARWISAHSMYFKILGEYGFGGLFLLLTILGTNLVDQLKMVRRLRSTPQSSSTPMVWPGLLAVALVGYAVAGAFLGGVAYPHLFLLTGLTVACRRRLQAEPGMSQDTAVLPKVALVTAARSSSVATPRNVPSPNNAIARTQARLLQPARRHQ
jgi:probable O-glycosylation ligase (exosortase A-associated)